MDRRSLRSRRSAWGALGLGARAGLAFSLVVASCAAESPPPEAPRSQEERATRISELEAEIAQDHATLQALVSLPRTETDPPLYREPELEAIARRLRANERELEQLRRIDDPIPKMLR